jgi:transcriptional regulator with XRE-family HTH domain
MSDEVPTRSLTLAEKLDMLFRRGHPRGRDEYSYEEVAAGIKQMGLVPVSGTLLWELRTGKKTNPRMQQLESIAGFFGIKPSYFFNDEAFEMIDAQLELFAAMRDNNVRQLALRAADLSPETLRMLAHIIERARKLEGLPSEEQEEVR